MPSCTCPSYERTSDSRCDDGKPWSEMDLFDLRTSLAYGRSIEEVADFLCRSDTVEEVRRKAEELGCYRLTLLGTSAAPICFPSGALITIIHAALDRGFPRP